MRHPNTAISVATLLVAGSMGGCGLGVPKIEEAWDDDIGINAIPLERRIKEKIYCELNRAISDLNNDPSLSIPVLGPDPKTRKQKLFYRKAVPESYGVTMNLNLTVAEMTAFNPSLAFNTPLRPRDTRFPDGTVVAGPQSAAVGLGGSVSAEATRYDKYTFFYKVTNLESYNLSCDDPESPSDVAPKNFKGSSLLLESELGIKRWLRKMRDLRTGIGVSDKDADKSSAQVFTYDVKFDVISSGGITPTWRLTPVTTPIDGLPLLSVKRQRTHELILTLGPLSDTKDQPSQLSLNDNLAAQVGSAVGAALR